MQVGMCLKQRSQCIQVGFLINLVGNDDSLHAMPSTHAGLENGCETNAPSASFYLHGIQLGGHGGFAVRRNV